MPELIQVYGRKKGRPPRAEARGQVFSLLLSPDEMRKARIAAEVNHQTVSAFVRDAIVDAAYECLEPFPEDEHERQCQP